VSNLGAGVLNETVGVRATLQVAAGVAILGAVYGLWRLTKVEKQAPTNREEIDAIRRVDAFRPLSVAAANQLADALVDQETAEDEVVVRQGEPGDDMFLIRSGVFDTTVDGEHARTLQRGDHFGEIALLFNAPRTATVRCTQAGELWHLRREDFLRAITGNTATEEAMTAIANQRLAHAGAVDLSQGGGG
jgi:signal-transduction protein with cAMP-binding, CBS, and nucleotidyltransferase domain